MPLQLTFPTGAPLVSGGTGRVGVQAPAFADHIC